MTRKLGLGYPKRNFKKFRGNMLRKRYFDEIQSHFRVHSICAILGPRQVGKTTLARQFAESEFAKSVAFFDLEDPIDLHRLDNPMFAITDTKAALIVIDEVQLRPDLFPILRVLVDRPDNPHRFLILGSASRDLIQQSSETLAGRIGYIELPPFGLFEVQDSSKLMVRGGFPRSYLAETEADSYKWRQSYIATFLERDIPTLGFNVPAPLLYRFWMMLAHYHGQTLNSSELARSLMVSDQTIRRYLDILVGTFMVRTLQPWFENISKRQVKAPKIYLRDIGILNNLLSISNKSELDRNPKMGAIWEGFALEEVVRFLGLRNEEIFFWSTHAEAELDLLVNQGGRRIGFEFKHSDAPKITKSMHMALDDLKLDRLYIIYPGDRRFALSEKVVVCGLGTFVTGSQILIEHS